MQERRTHWLDGLGLELWQEIREMGDASKEAIRGDVPVGQVEKLPQEQLADFLGSTPEQLEMMMQTVGPEAMKEYMSEMKRIGEEQLGPLANTFSAFNEEGW